MVSVVQSSADDKSFAKKKAGGVINVSFKSTPTILARDLTIDGELNSVGLIEIEGKVKGTVSGHSIILREGGFVEGRISAESVSIRGSFNGDINAKTINISSKAKVVGNIEYELLSVEDGACIDGQFKKIKIEE